MSCQLESSSDLFFLVSIFKEERSAFGLDVECCAVGWPRTRFDVEGLVVELPTGFDADEGFDFDWSTGFAVDGFVVEWSRGFDVEWSTDFELGLTGLTP